jgi:hypothetical protein
VQCLGANLQNLFIFSVPLRDARVEIPAVVIEAGLARLGFNFSPGFLLDMSESHDHVSNLHASVVNVILNVDFPSCKTQKPDEGVAKNCISQVADVGGLVGIDARVLDENLSGGNGDTGFWSATNAAAIQPRSIFNSGNPAARPAFRRCRP